MASMNTRLNIENLDANIVQKHGGSKQVGFKQLRPGVETGFHEVHDEKRVWFENGREFKGIVKLRFFRLVTMILQWLKDGWRTSNLKRRQTQTAWSTQQCTKSVVAKHLGVAGIQQQNGLVDETNVTLFAKVTIISDWIQEAYRYVRVFFVGLLVLSKGCLNQLRNMGFNESGEYKKTFIGSGVGTGSMKVLHGFEFEVEPLARDRDQHLACELFRYREDSNEAVSAVAVVEKIYAYESLTFNNTVAYEIISKCKARLKDDMDAQSDAEIWVTKGLLVKAKGNILGLETIRDQSGNTLRVSQSRIHNEKLVQTFLRGNSTLSLEDSLSGDCDVEKNDKWSYIYICSWKPGVSDFDYAMGRSITVMSRSITRYGLMILGCAGSLKANLQHMEALSTTGEGYMTFTEAWKKEIWLKGLLTEPGYELRLVACIATGALVKDLGIHGLGLVIVAIGKKLVDVLVGIVETVPASSTR
ncbi:hypothetical protein Tco_1304129 [Tanacetum coccineum]